MADNRSPLLSEISSWNDDRARNSAQFDASQQVYYSMLDRYRQAEAARAHETTTDRDRKILEREAEMQRLEDEARMAERARAASARLQGPNALQPPAQPLQPPASSGWGPPPSDVGILGDTFSSFAQGGIGGLQALTDVAGADNPVSQTLRDAREYWANRISPERRAELALQAKETAALGPNAPWLNRAGLWLGQMARNPLQSAAEGFGNIAPLAALGPLGKLAGVGARAVAVGTGAAMGAGAVKGGIYDTTYQALVSQGVPEAEAQARAAEAQSYSENSAAILAGTLIGAAAGRYGADEAIAGLANAPQAVQRAALQKMADPSLLRTALGGAAREVITEGPQESAETWLGNRGAIGAGARIDPWRGVAEAGVKASVLSALPGAAGHVGQRANARSELAQLVQQEAARNAPEVLYENDPGADAAMGGPTASVPPDAPSDTPAPPPDPLYAERAEALQVDAMRASAAAVRAQLAGDAEGAQAHSARAQELRSQSEALSALAQAEAETQAQMDAAAQGSPIPLAERAGMGEQLPPLEAEPAVVVEAPVEPAPVAPIAAAAPAPKTKAEKAPVPPPDPTEPDPTLIPGDPTVPLADDPTTQFDDMVDLNEGFDAPPEAPAEPVAAAPAPAPAATGPIKIPARTPRARAAKPVVPEAPVEHDYSVIPERAPTVHEATGLPLNDDGTVTVRDNRGNLVNADPEMLAPTRKVKRKSAPPPPPAVDTPLPPGAPRFHTTSLKAAQERLARHKAPAAPEPAAPEAPAPRVPSAEAAVEMAEARARSRKPTPSAPSTPAVPDLPPFEVELEQAAARRAARSASPERQVSPEQAELAAYIARNKAKVKGSDEGLLVSEPKFGEPIVVEDPRLTEIKNRYKKWQKAQRSTLGTLGAGVPEALSIAYDYTTYLADKSVRKFADVAREVYKHVHDKLGPEMAAYVKTHMRSMYESVARDTGFEPDYTDAPPDMMGEAPAEPAAPPRGKKAAQPAQPTQPSAPAPSTPSPTEPVHVRLARAADATGFPMITDPVTKRERQATPAELVPSKGFAQNMELVTEVLGQNSPEAAQLARFIHALSPELAQERRPVSWDTAHERALRMMDIKSADELAKLHESGVVLTEPMVRALEMFQTQQQDTLFNLRAKVRAARAAGDTALAESLERDFLLAAAKFRGTAMALTGQRAQVGRLLNSFKDVRRSAQQRLGDALDEMGLDDTVRVDILERAQRARQDNTITSVGTGHETGAAKALVDSVNSAVDAGQLSAAEGQQVMRQVREISRAAEATATEKRLQALPGAKGEFGLTKAELAQAMEDALADPTGILAVQRLSKMDPTKALVELSRANPLWNVATPTKNFFSNVLQAARTTAEILPAAAVDKARVELGLLGPGAKRTIYAGEFNAAMRAVGDHGPALWKQLQADLGEVLSLRGDELMARYAKNDPTSGHISEHQTPAIPGATGRVVRSSFATLAALDQFAKGLAVQQSMYRQLYAHGRNSGLKGEALNTWFSKATKEWSVGHVREGTVPLRKLQNMTSRAIRDAQYTTFTRPPRELGAVVGGIVSLLNSIERAYPMAGVVFRYKNTPGNIAHQVTEHLPTGYLSTFEHAARLQEIQRRLADATGEKALQLQRKQYDAARDFAESVVRATAGTAMLVMGAGMAGSGLLRGAGDPDPRKRRRDVAQGRIANSLSGSIIGAGGNWLSFDDLVEPASTLLPLAADLYNTRGIEDNKERAAAMLTALNNAFVNKGYLRTVSQLGDIFMDPDRYAADYVQDLVGSTLVPGIVSQEADAVDPYLRGTDTTLNELLTPAGVAEAAVEGVKKRIPGLSMTDKTVPNPLTGEPLRRASRSSEILGMPRYLARSPFNPTRVVRTGDVPDPLAAAFEEADFIPGDPSKQLSDSNNAEGLNVSVKLTPDEWQHYMDERQKASRWLRQRITAPDFVQEFPTPAERKQLFAATYKAALDRARDRVRALPTVVARQRETYRKQLDQWRRAHTRTADAGGER